MTPKPPYKSVQGQWLKRALFWDMVVDLHTSVRSEFKPLFTLHHKRDGFICARETFVEERDPTGRKWAMKYLGDWEHWLALMQCKWFVEAYELWIAELNSVLKSEALEIIREIAVGGSSQALAAAKYIANAEYEKTTTGRGRPSKAEIAGELKNEIKKLSAEDEDLARIGLKVINGGKA